MLDLSGGTNSPAYSELYFKSVQLNKANLRDLIAATSLVILLKIEFK